MATEFDSSRRFVNSFSPVLAVGLLLILLSSVSPALVSQNAQVVPALEPGKPIERAMVGDQAHAYSVVLTAGQYLHLVVDQRGIDVVVTLFAPDGKKLLEVDSPNGSQGREPLSLITETPGTYRLELRSLDKTAAAGRYELKIEELRTAVAKDKNRIAAEEAFTQATLVLEPETAAARRSAIEKYKEALTLFTAVGDQERQALTLLLVGKIYRNLGETQKALDYFTRALPLTRATADRSEEAEVLTRIGSSYNRLGQKQKALDYYNAALPLRREVGDRLGEAQTLNSIGNFYTDLGEKKKALDCYNQALVLFRAAGDRGGEASALNNIGTVYRDLGELQKALDCYSQALPLERAARDRADETITLNNLGTVYTSQGEVQKALEHYGLSLFLARDAGDRFGEAVALNNIGNVFAGLGESRKALGYLEHALLLRRAVGDRLGERVALNNIGRLYNDLGEKQKAIDYYNQALPISRAIGDRRGEAEALNDFGTVYGDLGEKQKALAYYAQALTLERAIEDRIGEGVTLNNIGLVYADIGEKQKAIDCYNKAMALFVVAAHRRNEANTQFNLAWLERNGGDLFKGLNNIEAALTIVESLRTKIGSQELRTSYFATVQRFYELYIDLLMQLHKQKPSRGYDIKALQASERGRARSLLETLAEANADIRRGVDTTLLERERGLQQRYNATAQEQARVLSRPHKDEQAQAIAQLIEDLATEWQQVETEIRQTSPSYAALTQPQPLTLKEIQTKVLDADTVLLEYSLGMDRSYLWVVTPDSIKSYELPKRDEIQSTARRVYDRLNSRNKRIEGETQSQRAARILQSDGEILAAASALSQMLIAPVSAQLKKKRLVIVADGVLQYIPFAVLPDPAAKAKSTATQPLIVDHEIVSLPSASTIALIRREVAGRRPAPRSVVVLADPVFMKSDERVKGGRNTTSGDATKAPTPVGAENVKELQLVEAAEDTDVSSDGLNVPRLAGTRREAEEIMAMVPASERKLALDFDASRATASSAELSQYRYVHFSTHGFLNSVHPELSGLVFSLVNERGEGKDGFLRAHEVFNLKLPAELVVLSACQTGIGKEVKGEGLVSLTRGFMYAGAPRVVVSLWSVSENGTTELMVRFYREILKEGKRPAAALRAAQISLMKEKKWQSPFYWAAFTLQGEWR